MPPLSLNDELSNAASSKADNMFAEDYWAHNSPDGKTPWVFIKGAGYNYTYAGENLARGFTSAQDVVNAWMASPEHRQNMLSTNYQNVGYAVETGKLSGEDTVLVVEMLGSTALAAAPASTNQLAAKTQQAVITTAATPLPTPTLEPSSKPQETAVPSLIAKTQQTVLNASKTPSPKPLIDSQTLSTNVSEAVVALFILALVLDMVVIERRRVVRLVGHNMDHILFLTLLLILISLIVRGAIV